MSVSIYFRDSALELSDSFCLNIFLYQQVDIPLCQYNETFIQKVLNVS